MAALKDLYQEIILDHCKRPRNRRGVDRANRLGDGTNPLCGDEVHVSFLIEEGVIRDIGFTGSGCAISIASASMMTEALKGKSVADAKAMVDMFGRYMASDAGNAPDAGSMGDLAVFANLRGYPVRTKCATLAWSAAAAALEYRQ
jgi:nitrogen fixation NifU-like protein